jgi:hypothetical protein
MNNPDTRKNTLVRVLVKAKFPARFYLNLATVLDSINLKIIQGFFNQSNIKIRIIALNKSNLLHQMFNSINLFKFLRYLEI